MTLSRALDGEKKEQFSIPHDQSARKKHEKQPPSGHASPAMQGKDNQHMKNSNPPIICARTLSAGALQMSAVAILVLGGAVGLVEVDGAWE